MSKKKIILISTISFVVLIGLGLFSYYYQHTPTEITKNISKTTDEDEINRYLTDNFISRIKNDNASSKEFLEDNVSDYEVSKNIESTQVTNKTNAETTVTIIIRTTTTNKKSGFRVITEDTYRAKLVKEGISWKIDEYNLISSKTVS